MEMPQVDVNVHLEPLLQRIIPLYQQGKLTKNSEHFWAARAALTFSQGKNVDRGIFSVYLFNLVGVQKGEAIFQDAGVPHAYLEGQNVEIMASSDNVLRGGLTTKHIDVKELLKHVKCVPTVPKILTGEKQGPARVFKTPAPDFELTAYKLQPEESTTVNISTTEILLLVEGEAEIESNAEKLDLKPGQPTAVAFAGNAIRISARAESLIFKAAVPSPQSE
jgi:mannose-6-phosphate isomerase